MKKYAMLPKIDGSGNVIWELFKYNFFRTKLNQVSLTELSSDERDKLKGKIVFV